MSETASSVFQTKVFGELSVNTPRPNPSANLGREKVLKRDEQFGQRTTAAGSIARGHWRACKLQTDSRLQYDTPGILRYQL